MGSFGNEFQLLLAVLLNAAVWGCAYAFARRRGGAGALQAACDAFLIWYVVQYAAVALPGAAGALNLATMSAVAFTAAGLLWFGARPRRGPASPPRLAGPDAGRFVLVGCGLFVAGYMAAHVHAQRWDPPRATDTLVYHLPAAVQWLQTGRLGLYPTWYWNAANAWSPLAGSTFMAWLIAPMGNDVLVRFVQAPALLFLFFLIARLCRALGCAPATAGLLAAAAVLSRPLFSQLTFPKDDLFVAAFLVAVVVAMSPDNLRDRLGPWRAGAALGMLLGMKYTVVLVCPLLLFLIDAPLRAGWRARHWALAVGAAVLLAGPWYLRNAVLTGNPLYPLDVRLLGIDIFQGLFTTARAEDVRHLAGIRRVLFDTYHSLPLPVAIVLLLGCAGAIIATGGRALLRDPLRRAVLVGTPLTLASFVVTLPNQEVRFAFPLFALLFAAVVPALARWGRPAPVAAAVAAALVVLSLATSTSREMWPRILEMAVAPLLVATLAAVAWAAQLRHLRLSRKSLALGATFAALPVTGFVYVEWTGYVESYLLNVPQRASHGYPAEAPLWAFVREQVPPDATVAVANTYLRYPLYDANLRRRVVYAPVRSDVTGYADLPRLADAPIPADRLNQAVTATMNARADREAWLANLQKSGATHLVIGVMAEEPDPPERRFVAQDRSLFEPLYSGPGGSVYAIHLSR